MINDPHFNACLSSFLAKLVAKQELSADLKNIQKSTFESIEAVVCTRLEKLLKMNNLIQGYEAREISIETLLEDRLRLLKKRIRL